MTEQGDIPKFSPIQPESSPTAVPVPTPQSIRLVEAQTILGEWADDEDFGYTGEEGDLVLAPEEWPTEEVFRESFEQVSLADRQEQRRKESHLPSLDLGPHKLKE